MKTWLRTRLPRLVVFAVLTLIGMLAFGVDVMLPWPTLLLALAVEAAWKPVARWLRAA